MKSKRRTLAVLTTLVIGAIGLVACGNAATPTQVAQKPAATATPAPPTPSVAVPSLQVIENTVEPTAVATSRPTAPDVPSPTPTQPTPSSTPLPTLPPPTPPIIQHTVQTGDSLWGLATRYGVSMAAIQLTNALGDSTGLVAGQTLNVPSGAQWPGESAFWVIHVIQPGETLIGLASAYDLGVDEILNVNAIADPTLIHPGQQLVLPLTGLLSTSAPSPTATPALRAEPQDEAAIAAASVQTALTHTPAPPLPTAPAPPAPAGPADWPGYILARINQARAAHGLNTLTMAPELTQAAQAHAQDCAQRGWGSHVGSDGAVLKTRLERAGYFGSNYGENWVQALDAERAFDWWYGEIPPNDPHRRNILSTHYSEVGIGIVQMDWGYVFITDFGRR